MGPCQSAMAAMSEQQKKAEDAIRQSGGGDMLDKMKEAASEGVPIAYGKTVNIPDLATKGGECHVGVKYMCKEGKTIDAQFCAIEFNKAGEKMGAASYEETATADGAVTYLGDQYGSEGGEEYVSLKLADLGDCVMGDYESLKLMFKAVAGETILPVCYMPVDACEGDHTGVTCLAVYKEGDSWVAKNVTSKGSGPAATDLVPACQELFGE